MIRALLFNEAIGRSVTELGKKGHGLVKMQKYGLPVPPGFIIPVSVFRNRDKTADIGAIVRCLESLTPGVNVSVRSGAAISMPGMMDTVLDVIPNPLSIYDAVKEVWDSWDTPRAIEYRRINKIDDNLGTAVVVQQMVYGDKDERSGSGVLFTKDPITKDDRLVIEWLRKSKGDAVVLGLRTPESGDSLRSCLPDAYDNLVRISRDLEDRVGAPLDIEFTIESGKVWFLQMREIKFPKKTAKQKQIKIRGKLHGTGLPASPGIVTGTIVLTTTEAVERSKKGESVILLRPITSPDDLEAMNLVAGILTVQGGVLSHAALIARSINKPCVVGCKKAEKLKPGMVVTINGDTGEVYKK